MSTEQDRERNLEAEVPEGVSPKATRTGTETDSAASYGSAPISEAEAQESAAASAASEAEGEGASAGQSAAAGESTATGETTAAGETTATGQTTAAGESTAAGETTAADELTAADKSTAAGQREIGDQPLFGDADVERLRAAWRQLQSGFVDNPHEAVTQADDLVAATVQQLSSTLAERKQSLERLWSREEDGETEDLRLTLRSYHAFFDRLVGTAK
ncbi:hypothetical protein [Nocardia nepalensis]|uniref:hypothetical protein n=1 Tax=Nocardia nepalensis TaxID=3375448 RepID=UPI003B685007